MNSSAIAFATPDNIMTNRISILKVWVNINISIDYFLLLKITSAAIQPGIQPRSVRIKVITIFPHP
jgi:uncharacterized membrane protein YpjA